MATQSVGISCPNALNDVTIQSQGPPQTICVSGTYLSGSLWLKFWNWLVPLLRALLFWTVTQTSATILVRILPAGAPQPSPTPPQPGDVNISPPMANWCANPIGLPTGTTSFVVWIWLLGANGNILDGPHSTPFSADGQGKTNCCSACSGS
jgi:hypothetical protein